jgi:hypothetical protein
MLAEPELPENKIIVDQDSVEKTIKSLKNGKSTGYHGISNEMVKYSINKTNKRMAKCYTSIFNKIIESSQVPDNFNVSIIKPIIKDDKKPSNNKSNLRPVAVSDVSDVCFEKTVAKILRKQCKTNDKQFGFKRKSSCGHAIFILKQTIKFANSINKRVYVCAIDASKAFDKVIRLILWWKLAKKGLNRMVLKALMAYYSVSKMKVQVNEEHSELFTTTEGTKQGGPILPDLFNEYGDELTDWISELEVGVIMGEMKIDIIQYADDITLVADTARGLQTQMDKCKAYGEEYCIQFNPDKTTIVVFNLKVKRTVNEMRADVWQGPFILCGKTVEVVNSVKILGQIISNDHRDDEHISKRKKAMHAMIGKLQAMNLNSLHIHPYMKAHLFKTYIRPILTYGIENMELNGNEILEFKKLESNAIKRLLRIPIRCKTTDLVDSLNIEQTNRYLMRMKLKFVLRLNKNDYTRSVLEFQTKFKLDNSF